MGRIVFFYWLCSRRILQINALVTNVTRFMLTLVGAYLLLALNFHYCFCSSFVITFVFKVAFIAMQSSVK